MRGLARINKQRQNHFRFGVLAVLCLLLTQVGNIYAHVCLDGQEPLVSLHFENLESHPEHPDSDRKHDDVEVALSEVPLLVKAKSGLDLGAVLLVRLLLPVEHPKAIYRLQRTVTVNPPLNYLLQPPLRGPPAIS